MKVNLDRTSSGFCIGVQGTIHLAEKMLDEPGGNVYCLGDIVHNEVEVKRLEKLGLITIDHDAYAKLHDAQVLFRAHGEPPSTYTRAEQNSLSVTDSTCPVVARLQRTARMLHELGFQIIIYGKKAHPEVIGINGQCGNRAVVIKHADLSVPEETESIDFNRRTALISQTTMDLPGFYALKDNLARLFSEKKGASGSSDQTKWHAVRDIDLTAEKTGVRSLPDLVYKDTICRQVSTRNSKLHDFAAANDRIIFVAGRKSSNGQVLYNICRQSNPGSHFIEDETELQDEWFYNNGKLVESVGVCGATSTPMWLLEKVARHIDDTYNS